MTDQGPASYERATSPADYGVTNTVGIGHGVQLSTQVDHDGQEIGRSVWHDCKHDYTACGITFDTEAGRASNPGRARWTVESLEPLTVSPSVLCLTCGLHGFIRNGQWVPA
jgi:hypothetical protein